MNTLAIDIGGTKISAALISRDNQLTQHRQIATPASPSPTQLYEFYSRVFAASKDNVHDRTGNNSIKAG